MATKVTMEALSPTMEEGRLVKWTKNEGDPVAAGDVLAEVETDKAVMELVARGDGVLRKRLANEGDSSPVGTLLAVIGTSDENIDSIVGGAGAAAPASAQSGQSAQGAAGANAGSANQAVADTQESAGKTSVPASPAQSQGEASTPPQQKAGGSSAAPPAPRSAPPPPPPRVASASRRRVRHRTPRSGRKSERARSTRTTCARSSSGFA